MSLVIRYALYILNTTGILNLLNALSELISIIFFKEIKMIRKLFCVLFTPLALVVDAQETPFEGTWQLVSGSYVNYEGKLINYKDLNLNSLKVISKDHFSFVTKSGDKFWSAGAGSYTFDDVQYTETPIHTSYSVQTGTSYVFQYKLEGDTWSTVRFENGKQVEQEKWVRVKY